MRFKVGLPRMHKEPGEKRDFLPELVEKLVSRGAEVTVEAGIGSGMGLPMAAYTDLSPHVSVGTREECFCRDLVLVLRSPEVEEFDALLRPGSILMSMLHLPTRPRRVRALQRLGVDGVSLDGLADDALRRLVENTRSVGWNGVEAAFGLLQTAFPLRLKPGAPVVRMTVLGAGLVGKAAVEAGSKYGNRARALEWAAMGVPAVEVTVLGRSLTANAAYMQARLEQTDILVDATQRSDPTRPLIPNDWLRWLPQTAVVADLVTDPYVPTGDPPTVRSIEGIPLGSLDQWAFLPGDPRWCDKIPAGVPSTHRRATVTCYSWPGIHPRECMELYGRQVWPLLERLVEYRSMDRVKPSGDALDRALWRGSLRAVLAGGITVPADVSAMGGV